MIPLPLALLLRHLLHPPLLLLETVAPAVELRRPRSVLGLEVVVPQLPVLVRLVLLLAQLLRVPVLARLLLLLVAQLLRVPVLAQLLRVRDQCLALP